MLQALKATEEAEKEWEADSPLQKGDIGLTAGLVHELKAALVYRLLLCKVVQEFTCDVAGTEGRRGGGEGVGRQTAPRRARRHSAMRRTPPTLRSRPTSTCASSTTEALCLYTSEHRP